MATSDNETLLSKTSTSLKVTLALCGALGIAGVSWLVFSGPAPGVSRSDANAVEQELKSEMIDPDSAKFTFWPHKEDGGSFCGLVNAKNRTGGYVGNKLFAVRLDSTHTSKAIVVLEDPDDSRSLDVLRIFCGDNHNELINTGYLSETKQTPQQANTSTSATASDAQAVAGFTTPEQPTAKWRYWDNTDKMSGVTSHFASLNSDNILNFDSPYHNQTVELALVRNADRQADAWISVKAQFLGYYPNGLLRVRFDTDKVQWWSCHEILGAPLGTLYIDGGRRFIKRLTKAKKLIVEARFYQSGSQQIEFSVAGLEWK